MPAGKCLAVVGNNGAEKKIAEVIPTATTYFQVFAGNVFIPEAGTYTLMFR